jgi:hypothetical protein
VSERKKRRKNAKETNNKHQQEPMGSHPGCRPAGPWPSPDMRNLSICVRPRERTFEGKKNPPPKKTKKPKQPFLTDYSPEPAGGAE